MQIESAHHTPVTVRAGPQSIAFAGRIVKAFFPVESPQRSSAQVIWWLKATGR